MGTRVGLREEQSWGYGDQSWINGRLGYDQCRSGTLNLALFATAHVNSNGDIPSGTVLGVVTATGLYGPYDPDGSDGRQTAAGFLFYDVHVRNDATGENDLTGKQGFALFGCVGGAIVKASRLPAFDGTVDGELDSDARTDLKALGVRFE